MSESIYGQDFPEPSPDELDPSIKRTWRPVDLSDVLAGEWQQVEPVVGHRTDGVGLFYPGKCHTISSESEAGKTWLALAAAADVIRLGGHVIYVDFEDDVGPVVSRMLALGVEPADLAERFHYIRPESPLSAPPNEVDVAEVFRSVRPALAVLDGVTEAMTMHGLNPLDNADCAKFGRMLPRRMADLGAAVASLDHVTKSADGRGRYSIGAVHKLNSLDGAAYVLENRTALGVGLVGRSTILLAKDRPAQLRQHARPGKGMHWFGDLVVDATDLDPSCLVVSIEPPTEARAESMMPTIVMQRVAEVLEKHPEGLSQRVLSDVVTGKTPTIRSALSHLIEAGFVSDKTPHRLLKPYPSAGGQDD